MAFLADRRTDGDRPAEVISTTLNGITFRAGRRTAAHLTWTDETLRSHGTWLRLIQPCYNQSVAASAGTHDYDGCVDVEVEGMSWTAGQAQLRELGWAAWYRPNTPGLWSAHIHMVSLGCPGPVGEFVPGQVDDYYRHALGLKGQHDSGDDASWHPADIDSTVFDYPAWMEDQPMTPQDKQDIIDGVVKALTEGKPDGSTLSRDALLKQAQKASVEARDLLKSKP